jgi:dTMP kinase
MEMRKSKGKFIVLEGGDGTGKNTQIELLKERFGSKEFLYTEEPGGSRLGNKIRAWVTEQDEETMCIEAELLLFSASRAQHVHEKIAPALALGINVICSRFSLSTIAYQLYGREQLYRLEAFYHIDQFAVGNTKPNLYILLDADPEVGRARQDTLGFVKDRIENEAFEFHKRVREGYLAALPPLPYGIRVDANRPVEKVQRDLAMIVHNCLSERQPKFHHHVTDPVTHGFPVDSTIKESVW